MTSCYTIVNRLGGVKVTDKMQIKKSLWRLQKVKTWQLIILLVLMSFVAATFLRLNNIGMVQRRTAVLAADEAGDSEIIQNRLYDLQRYVSDHMNTDLDKGVYLETSYKKAVQAAYETASNDNNPNGNIYKKAQQVCAPQFTHWSMEYIRCTTGELAKYPAASNLVGAIKLPNVNTYKYDFVSPLWSADFAGWSVLICVVILLMIFVRLTSVALLKILLRHRYKSI